MSRTRRNTCCRPLRGGTTRSTWSVKNSRPTLSLFVTAENASVAATCADCSCLNCDRVPNCPEPEASTSRNTVSSRSSTNFFTYGRSMRAVTFQSMVRMSSPGRYSRMSTNSMPVPLNVERYSPTKVVLMILRVCRSIWRSLRRISGDSMRSGSGLTWAGRATGPRRGCAGAGTSRDFDRGQDALDHVIGGQLLRLGLVGQDDAVPEHVRRQLLDVLRDDEAAALQERHGPDRGREVDRSARRGPEADQRLQFRQPVLLRLARREHQVEDVVLELAIDVHLPAQLAGLDDVGRLDDRHDRRLAGA